MLQCEVFDDEPLGACCVRGNPAPCENCLAHFDTQEHEAKLLREGGYESAYIRRNVERLERKRL